MKKKPVLGSRRALISYSGSTAPELKYCFCKFYVYCTSKTFFVPVPVLCCVVGLYFLEEKIIKVEYGMLHVNLFFLTVGTVSAEL